VISRLGSSRCPKTKGSEVSLGVRFGALPALGRLDGRNDLLTTDEKSRFRMKRITAAFVSRHDKYRNSRLPMRREPTTGHASEVAFDADERQFDLGVHQIVAATSGFPNGPRWR
jgi:hypothetical protein